MPTHPAPPESLQQLVDAYASTAQAVLDLAITCRDDEFDRATDCPGWTVKDQISHIVGTESALLGGRDPQVEVPDYPHLTSDLGRWIEHPIEVRRARTGAQVTGEWKHVLARRLKQLRDPQLTLESPMRGPFGESTVREVLELRIFDTWVHEQDLRRALGRPGNLDTAGAALFVSRLLKAFPGRVAKQADVPDGATVILESTGPIQAREGVRMSTDETGKRIAEPLFSGHDHRDKTGELAPMRPDTITTIRMSTEELARRGAGRVATSDLRYSVDGDEALAARVLDALVITP